MKMFLQEYVVLRIFFSKRRQDDENLLFLFKQLNILLKELEKYEITDEYRKY